MLPQVSGSQEGTGVKILPWKFDNLLGFDPAAVHELEALQVDNLKSTGLKMSDAGFIVVPTLYSFPKLKTQTETDQNRGQPPKVQLLGG